MPGRFRQRAVVLLVEDNPDDVVMIRAAFEQSLTPIQLYVVSKWRAGNKVHAAD